MQQDDVGSQAKEDLGAALRSARPWAPPIAASAEPAALPSHDGEWRAAGNGSGTERGYRVEARCDHPFVAWDIRGSVCMASPKGEFVIGPEWRIVPLAEVAAPLGIAPRGLELHHFSPSEELVCYETAKALQYALIARYRHTPYFQVRITEVEHEYRFTKRERSEAPVEGLFRLAFEPARRDAPQDTPPAAKGEALGRADAREVPT